MITINIKKTLPVLMLAATSVLSCNTFAHHSSAPHFDKDNILVIENASIVEWKFVNPHSYLYFDVTSDDGELVHWRCESTAATMLRRNGWTADTLTVGQKVTIKGEAARREDNVCSLTSITLADGTEIGRSDNVADAIAAAPEETGPIERPARLSNGQPNFSGTWLTLSFGPGSKGGEPPPNLQGAPTWGGYELTAKGLELAEKYDVRFDDPSLHCHPINIIEGWNHDVNVNEIFQYDDKIVLQYGFVDFVRTIHLGMDEHPANIVPSVGGHSIGHWEDDVLVVDTVGFEPGLLLHQGGVHHSANMHIVERFHRDSETNELVREYTISDPEYFVGLRKGIDYMGMTNAPYTPFNCVELSGANNKRPE
jgi:hypothetical protein